MIENIIVEQQKQKRSKVERVQRKKMGNKIEIVSETKVQKNRKGKKMGNKIEIQRKQTRIERNKENGKYGKLKQTEWERNNGQKE